MKNRNLVFIATSLDGYIADKNGGVDWLHSIPNPENDDMGYDVFMASVDALLMGRKTFETVLGFGIEWPYQKPVFVLSSRLQKVSADLEGKVHLVNGTLSNALDQIHEKGHYRLYVDGGTTIQSFLREDLIDEMTITIIPKLLGGGIPLFSDLPRALDFECVESKRYLDQIVQNRFVRLR